MPPLDDGGASSADYRCPQRDVRFIIAGLVAIGIVDNDSAGILSRGGFRSIVNTVFLYWFDGSVLGPNSSG